MATKRYSTIEEALSFLKDLADEEELDDYADDIPEENLKFEAEMKKFLAGLISEDTLSEQFESEHCAEYHFDKHRIGGKRYWVIHKSHPETIGYDFQTLEEYKNYEQQESKKLLFPDAGRGMIIHSLKNITVVAEAFHKLFKGNFSILFTPECKFMNLKGSDYTAIGFTSFANDATTNYGKENTLNLFFINTANKTTSLYPIKAHRIESEFNRIVRKSNVDPEVLNTHFDIIKSKR